MAAVAREYDMWFHVDGAYGAFAATLPDAPPELKALVEHVKETLAIADGDE